MVSPAGAAARSMRRLMMAAAAAMPTTPTATRWPADVAPGLEKTPPEAAAPHSRMSQ